jgi:hypothetical protein
MTTTTNVLREDAKRTWEKLQTLRDEVRVKLHLAGMDARDEWDRLEALMPEMEKEMEHAASDASKATKSTIATSIDEAIKRLEKVRASLQKR